MNARALHRRLVLLPAVLASLGCNTPGGTSSGSGASPSTAPSPAASASLPLVLAPRDGIRWSLAPAGLTDAALPVREAIAKANADGRTLLVYVGASWCEPCQRFHHAVEQGELDAAFPRLSILAFDADQDAAALAAAGYASRLIPLFAVPKSDGRASGKQIEGSVKGEAAVSEITPRLRALVSGGS
jgi:thiol-disulfide isomerase/thioredoxin